MTSQEEATPNPLAEASTQSVDELMSGWPILRQDLKAICAIHRKQREQWAVDEAQGKRKATRVTGVTLEQLGLVPKKGP